MDPHEARLYTGQTFAGHNGTYLVGGLIGSGGFGGVFEGVDQSTREDVAIKVLAFNGRPANAQIEFEAEIELLGLLVACSNIVTLLDKGIYNVSLTTSGLVFPVQLPFMVLDRAAVGLEDLLAHRHKLSWLDRLRLYRDIVKGNHQMHLKRLVHRDLKSANALVYEQEPTGASPISGEARTLASLRAFHPTNTRPAEELRFAPPELLWGLGETYVRSSTAGLISISWAPCSTSLRRRTASQRRH